MEPKIEYIVVEYGPEGIDHGDEIIASWNLCVALDELSQPAAEGRRRAIVKVEMSTLYAPGDEIVNDLCGRILASLGPMGEKSISALCVPFRGYTQREREEALKALQALGLVEGREESSEGRGRPATIYRRTF